MSEFMSMWRLVASVAIIAWLNDAPDNIVTSRLLFLNYLEDHEGRSGRPGTICKTMRLAEDLGFYDFPTRYSA